MNRSVKNPNSKFLIYILCEPEDRVGSAGRLYRKGEIRWVGISSSGNRRPGEHKRAVRYLKASVVNYYANWLRCLERKGTIPIVEVLDKGPFDSYQQLKETEVMYIAYFKSLGFKLVNSTIGGEGLMGFHHSEESKLKMSESKLALGWRPSVELTEQNRLAQKTRKPIVDSNGVEYPSVKYAADVHDIDRCAITNSLRKRIPVKSLGISFRYCDPALDEASYTPPKQPKVRTSWEICPVVDDLGNEYLSTIKAAKANGVSKHSVRDSIDKKRPVWKIGRTFFWK